MNQITNVRYAEDSHARSKAEWQAVRSEKLHLAARKVTTSPSSIFDDRYLKFNLVHLVRFNNFIIH